MKKYDAWFMLLWMFLACGGCGQINTGAGMGGYKEQALSFSDMGEKYTGGAAGERTLRLIREDGQDMISEDGGNTFREDENVPWIFTRWRCAGICILKHDMRNALAVAERLAAGHYAKSERQHVHDPGGIASEFL